MHLLHDRGRKQRPGDIYAAASIRAFTRRAVDANVEGLCWYSAAAFHECRTKVKLKKGFYAYFGGQQQDHRQPTTCANQILPEWYFHPVIQHSFFPDT